MSDYDPKVARAKRPLVSEGLFHAAAIEQKMFDAFYTKKEVEDGETAREAELTKPRLTLPLDSQERKNYPLMRGCLRYFPAALAGVAKVSRLGNDKHNPGQELHHDREKSMDHGDCIVRHLLDTEDLLSASADKEQILLEVSQLVWRALAYSQELHEKFGAPLAPGAKK